jgi:glycerol-3-phosphate dehydrogenase
VEKDDLAGHTSSASSKLIHGGLRYLEYGELRLVREALAEREVLLRLAPHLIRPLRFVLPHAPHLRPAWMIRAGLLLYDGLARHRSLPRSRAIVLAKDPAGALLKPEFTRGFSYYDAWVDDARLVVANARSAAQRGADIRTRTRCAEASRSSDGWKLRLSSGGGADENVTAAALVNATGAWVSAFARGTGAARAMGGVKLVKGSHIVLADLYEGDYACLLQNPDRRVVFLLPYARGLAAIGTTDVAVANPDELPRASAEEIDYLCAAASRYCRRPIHARQVVHTWSGVRALFDDGAPTLASVTRDYHLLLDDAAAPVLSVYGGKITTYRKLAEHALARLKPFFPAMGSEWTAGEPLPGGDFSNFEELHARFRARYPVLDDRWLEALLRRHGSAAGAILDGVETEQDLGTRFVDGLYGREVDYLRQFEWATTADDILWRRTKTGLHARPDEVRRLDAYLT